MSATPGPYNRSVMPTYEYECRECGHRFEVNQRISEEPLTVCEICGGPLRKLFHPVGISFKGSGFYVNDSRGSKESSGDSKKPERKPEKKPESTASAKEKTA